MLFVIGFHAFPKQFPGGFVGVDVFFVISGFLISGIIYRSMQQQTFSFLEFYARRARRIFPALIIVLIACASAGWFIMLQGEFRTLGWNTGAAAAFLANFAFFREAGYFGPAAEFSPLLHLWSLGIEEQYYLVWPLLVALCWRFRGAPLAVAATVLVVSFVTNIAMVRTDATAAFYLPLPRFWELMLGSGLAFVLAAKSDQAGPARSQLRKLYSRHSRLVHEVAAWAGVLLIGAALLAINRTRLFPGWWALLPTTGTALLILAGQTASINRLILSRNTVVYVGLISYPLYLWHWPILVFERLVRINEPTYLMRAAGVAAAFVLADLTYRRIEKPIRFGKAPRPKAIAVAVVLASVGCFGLVIFLADGFPERLQDNARALERDLGAGRNAINAARNGTCFLWTDPLPPFSAECDGTAGARKVVLWGDSYAAHLYSGLSVLEQTRADFSLAQYTSAGCPPILSYVSLRRTGCRALNDFAAHKIAELRADTVILAGRWEVYDDVQGWGEVTPAMIRTTVTTLAAMGVKRIVVIGQFPVWEAEVPRIRIARIGRVGADLNRGIPARFDVERDLDDGVRGALDGTNAIFVSPLATFCNPEGCLLAVPGQQGSVSSDNGHLTLVASEFFAKSNAKALLGD